MAHNGRSMQLLCTLCPKSPKFSDVSHLLTHISSKSHLSHRFKLQIRAQSEIAARKQLDDFDIWYHNSNLDALLADRLSMKESKKTAKERKEKPSKGPKRERKKEKKSESREVLDRTPVYRAPVPRMHLWHSEYASGSTPMDDWEHTTMYSTPSARRPVLGALQSGTPAGSMIDPSISTPWRADDIDAFDQRLPESAKLKGVYWPGMDLFDSATPEMKRMRNQRKDGTILEMMMAKASQVEPKEVSYLPSGEFRASRYIFGPLSTESSPTKSVAPSPKKRRTRKAFAEIGVNVPRLRHSRARKGPSLGSPAKRQSLNSIRRSHTVPRMPQEQMPTLNPLANFGNRFVATAEEDAEFKMTIEGFNRKQTFDIFRDNPEHSPVRSESPLEEHRFEFAHDGLPVYQSNSNHDSLISPTPLPKPKPVPAFGKENRTEQHELSTQYQRRQTASSSNVFPAQLFYDPSFNPLYSQMYRSYSYRDHQFGSHQDHKTAIGQTSTFHGNFKPFWSEHELRMAPSTKSAVASQNDNGSSQYNI